MRRLKQHREGISDCALAVLFLSTGRIWNSKRYNLLRGFNGRLVLYFRRFLGRIENWSQKSYKNTLIDLDRLGLNQSKQIEAGLSDNETRIKPQCGQWHQVPFGISSSPHSQQTC